MPTHIKSLSRHNISDGSLIWNGGSAQTGLAALPHKNIQWKHNDAANIAYAIQNLTIEAGVGLANKAFEITNSNNLCISGGCALNGYLNTEIIKQTNFKDVVVPPSVHDGGLSIGAVMFTINNILDLFWSIRFWEILL